MTTTAAPGGSTAAYRARCTARMGAYGSLTRGTISPWLTAPPRLRRVVGAQRSGPRAIEVAGSIMPADEGPPAGGKRRPLLALAGLGMTNGVCFLGGSALGWLVDSQLGTAPVFILVGMFSGIVSGVLITYKEARKLFDD